MKSVVVTRAEDADGPLSTELKNLGLPVLLWPAVTTTPADSGPLLAQLERIREFDWIVFASRHAVAAVTEHLPQPPQGLSIAAVGQATANVLTQRGWKVDLIPDEANAGALVAAFEARLAQRAQPREHALPPPADPTPHSAHRPLRALFPASSRALPTISAGLTQLGMQVIQVEAYQTDAASLDVTECKSSIAREDIGAVTFASPSAVIELERSLGKEDFDRLLTTAVAVAIGPTTARALADRGRPPVLAESATLQGLAQTTYRLLQTRH